MERRRTTIAVINYNYERFLAAAIDSALAQTHPDVQVVVVDDGSTDGSTALIKSYGDRITAVLKTNGGQASAMNAALEAATGEVVIFLDADDLVDPDTAAAVDQAFDDDVVWVMYRLRVIDGDGVAIGRVRPHRVGVMPNGDLRAHLRRFRCFHWQPTSGNAFAASALRRVTPIPEADFRISADAYLAAVVPVCGPVRSIDEVCGGYRVHQASNFTSAAVDARWFRDQIARQVAGHHHAVRIGREMGVDLPVDPTTPLDAAFLAFRLASLLLDPVAHPLPEDQRWRLALRGLVAALANPRLGWRTRLRRAAWFAACGVLPTGMAVRLAVPRTPDTPTARAAALR